MGNGAAAGLRDAFHSRRDRIPSVGKKVVIVRVARVKCRSKEARWRVLLLEVFL